MVLDPEMSASARCEALYERSGVPRFPHYTFSRDLSIPFPSPLKTFRSIMLRLFGQYQAQRCFDFSE